MAQQHHHDSLSQHTSQYSCSNDETQRHDPERAGGTCGRLSGPLSVGFVNPQRLLNIPVLSIAVVYSQRGRCMQTLQRSTFDIISGVSAEDNTLAFCAVADVVVGDVVLAEWHNTTYRCAPVIGMSLKLFHLDDENLTQKFSVSLSVCDTLVSPGAHHCCSAPTINMEFKGAGPREHSILTTHTQLGTVKPLYTGHQIHSNNRPV